MNTSLRRMFGLGCAALAAAWTCERAAATIIDFEGIPDGTPVSSLNPYAAIANIQATATFSTPIVGGGAVDDPAEATIVNGWIEVLHPNSSPPSLATWVAGEMTADFLQPVVNVAFDVGAEWQGGYTFQARNSQGAVFMSPWTSTGGLTPGVTWVHIEVPLPEGYGLTQLQYRNFDRDGRRYLAMFLIDNIRFDVAGVPDTGNGALLLALGGAGMLGVHRWLRRGHLSMR